MTNTTMSKDDYGTDKKMQFSQNCPHTSFFCWISCCSSNADGTSVSAPWRLWSKIWLF